MAIRPLIIAAALLPCIFSLAFGQSRDTLANDAQVLASFEQARALAVDAEGVAYVVDAGNSTVHRIDTVGVVDATWGGLGSGEYEFDDPMDLDVTNGLIIFVADAGNQRIKRYSRDYLFLDEFELGAQGRGGSRLTQGDPELLGTMRPIGVTVSLTNETFAINEDQSEIIKWDSARRLERTFGRFGEGPTLRDPASLTISNEGLLFVADRVLRAVVVYDSFGNYVRTMATGIEEDIRSLETYRNKLLVVTASEVRIFESRGRLETILTIDLGEPLIDVAVRTGGLYMLTESRLLYQPI